MIQTATDFDLDHASADQPIARRSRVWRSPRVNPTLSDQAGRPKGSLWTVAAFASLIGLGVAGVARLDDGPAPAQPEPSLGSLSSVVDQIGARSLWQQGITGAGINVALIDTGVAPVDALSNQIVAAVDFSSEQDVPATAFIDTNGHGTHLAGIIAGNGSSGFRGVAPDAGIVSIKVANQTGDVSIASIVSSIDWVVANADELDIRVLNIAFDAGTAGTREAEALEASVERAWAAGIVVVTAAGNNGTDSNGLNAPASNAFVIAVAGVEATANGFVVPDWASAASESRGPDLAAPGSHIQSLRAPGSDADANHPEGYVNEELFLGSGSSQSAAVTAGAVALLLDARPELTPDQVKALLMGSAADLPYSSARVGTGLLQIAEASAAATPTIDQTWAPTISGDVVFATDAIATIDPEWASSSWASSSWASSSWASSSWASSSWASSSWASSSWASSSWASSSWASSSWASSSWASSSWA
jgi:serine protease AprX